MATKAVQALQAALAANPSLRTASSNAIAQAVQQQMAPAPQVSASLPPTPTPSYAPAYTPPPPTTSTAAQSYNNVTGQAGPVVTTQSQAPTQAPKTVGVSTDGMKLQTGNPQLDDFLNNTWLPLIKSEMSADPTALFDSEAFKNIASRVESTWGPIYKSELKLAQDEFDRQKTALDIQNTAQTRQYGTGTDQTEAGQGTELYRGLEDIRTKTSRLNEDTNIGKQRIARNFQEALTESQAALASRSLLFGGTRAKEEANLAYNRDTSLADLERTQQRSLQDMGTLQSRAMSDIPFERQQGVSKYNADLTGLNAKLTGAQNTLAGEKILQQGEERKRLRDLGSSIISNPSFYSTLKQ